jgi:4-oxalocrotonate tautomerase
MPIIRVELWEGRTLEQKRQLARELTDVLVRIADCDESSVRVLFSHYSREDWAVAGVLVEDGQDLRQGGEESRQSRRLTVTPEREQRKPGP